MSVDQQVTQFLGRQRDQYIFHLARRTAATGLELLGRIGAHAILMKQPIKQAVHRQIGVNQFGRVGAGHQHHGAAPGVLVLLDGDIGRQALTALKRQALNHQPPGPPGAARVRRGDGDGQAGVDLLGFAEISAGAIGQGGALESNDALVAFGMSALINGEGQIATAQQAGYRSTAIDGAVVARRRNRRHLVGVESGVAAQVTGAGDIGDNGPHGAVSLGLERENTVVFQRPGEAGGERQDLRQQTRHRLGIAVAGQHRVDRRPQPHAAPAQAKGLDLKGQNQIVETGLEVDIGAGHGARRG